MDWEKKLREAKEILNSAEHMFYVTFKHSKNANVLYNIIVRLVEALEKLIDAVITYYYEEGILESYFRNPRIQAQKLVEMLKERWKDIKEFENLYLELRKMRRAKIEAINNFKRTVRLKIIFDSKNFKTIGPKDILDYLLKVKEYFKQIEDIVLNG